MTTPDDKVCLERDDMLRQVTFRETELFFGALIAENLTVKNLIDSDFSFLNRRITDYYGIPNVEDERFQRVSLLDGSVRGGVLTQVSILKVTANGMITSPVKRGTFVLKVLLVQPPKSPPLGIGSIEPNTR
ncbi:MAG: hypothetical protein M2R45_05122 [Verrucomicrobia subdivision 3 bacterium]|nr:hypothetical protein [Limisphaerales bacterium]MCS1417184.1 hypothetical protein [Limisphaerales bacterium]